MTPREKLLLEVADATKPEDEGRLLTALRVIQGIENEPLLSLEELGRRLKTSRSGVYNLGLKPTLYVGSCPRFAYSEVVAQLREKQLSCNAGAKRRKAS